MGPTCNVTKSDVCADYCKQDGSTCHIDQNQRPQCICPPGYTGRCDTCLLRCDAGTPGCSDAGQRAVSCDIDRPTHKNGQCEVVNSMHARCRCPLGYDSTDVYIGRCFWRHICCIVLYLLIVYYSTSILYLYCLQEKSITM